jgi:predicted ATPase
MALASPTLPLVGRASELAQLEATIAAVAGGRSLTVLLVGEGGVGKTRLARAAAEGAARRGFAVAEGRAYSVESGVPYAVFADALAPTLRRLDAAGLNVLTRGASAELAHIFPGLIAAPHAERGPSGESAAEAKARLYWTFVQLVGRLAARQPLLLVLDNLQWADAASLELLHFVARQAHEPGVGGRLLTIGIYTDAEGPVPTLLRDAEHSLVALGAARVERVGPLTVEQTLELVQRAFDAPADAVRGFAAMLHDWTRGNPFFVEETIKSLVESGRLAQREGRWTGWSVESIALPRSVRDAVLARVERLSGDTRALLDLAAVLGARVRYATLRAVRDVPDDVVLKSLDELLRARLLVESDDAGHDGYDFSHPLVRDAVYGAIGRPRAQHLHAQVAEALERLYGPEALAHADELAFHFARAGSGAPNRKALHYLAESGRRALERHADRAAATYLESALELLAADREVAGNDATLRSAVLEGLARARQRLGEHEVAESLWRRVREEAEQRGDRRMVAVVERRLGLMHAAGGRHDRALERFDAGLAEATDADDRALATRIRLARAISLQALGRRDEARRDVQAALDSAIALGD